MVHAGGSLIGWVANGASDVNPNGRQLASSRMTRGSAGEVSVSDFGRLVSAARFRSWPPRRGDLALLHSPAGRVMADPRRRFQGEQLVTRLHLDQRSIQDELIPGRPTRWAAEGRVEPAVTPGEIPRALVSSA